MSRTRVPSPLSSLAFEARLTPSHEAKTTSTRLQTAEMLAVREAAEKAGQSCSAWLRDAAIAHLKRPLRSGNSTPDPTLLTELIGLRQLTINLFAAVAAGTIPQDQLQEIVRQADNIKAGKADEILRRLQSGVTK